MNASSQLASPMIHASRLSPSLNNPSRSPSPSPLPEIPKTTLDLDLGFSVDDIMGPPSDPPSCVEKVQKRASNVLKLTQEHEKLKEELRAMTERLEAAERRRRELDSRQQPQHQPIHTFART